jgi:hypothetical protein
MLLIALLLVAVIARGEDFVRGEGVRFATAIADSASGFERAMWEFCRTTAGYKPPPSQRDCAFVAWAPDSSRLLLPLRVEINGTVRDWKVYWNTRTRSFELTPFLTELNARAVEESFSSLKPFCAEPVDPLPSLEALDRQIAEARAAFDEDWKECSAAEKAPPKGGAAHVAGGRKESRDLACRRHR